ncbi:MAG: suppressor of fused domain protein [Planctomycetes bacterium]|nr:suppressor of fused domain protein [Planctomycetota bacterium]
MTTRGNGDLVNLRMHLRHLNSDQRYFFWLGLLAGFVFTYLAISMDGILRVEVAIIAALEFGSAAAIYYRSRSALWACFAPSIALMSFAVLHWSAFGFSRFVAGLIAAGLFGMIAAYSHRAGLRGNDSEPEDESVSDMFVLPANRKQHVKQLVEAYQDAFGDPQWVHHVVPKTLWLHHYADHVVTIPPTDNRPTWLYGTLLISALSDNSVELILVRPDEDTIGAIGTLARLTEYYHDHSPLCEWHTMGPHPFYGDDSSVRGLLFCPPPAHLAKRLTLTDSEVKLVYVAGISHEQLERAQSVDDELGDFAGARKLHEELAIDSQGTANLPI